MASLRNKKDFETGLLLIQSLRFKQARNQLGTPRGEELSERVPNFLNYAQ